MSLFWFRSKKIICTHPKWQNVTCQPYPQMDSIDVRGDKMQRDKVNSRYFLDFIPLAGRNIYTSAVSKLPVLDSHPQTTIVDVWTYKNSVVRWFYVFQSLHSNHKSAWSYLWGDKRYWTYQNHSHFHHTLASWDVIYFCRLSRFMIKLLKGWHKSKVLQSNEISIPNANGITEAAKCTCK